MRVRAFEIANDGTESLFAECVLEELLGDRDEELESELIVAGEAMIGGGAAVLFRVERVD